MASLITNEPGAFAEALPNAGKLGGLDVGTKTIGIAICDAGWHFAGPLETIRRMKFTQDLASLRRIVAASARPGASAPSEAKAAPSRTATRRETPRVTILGSPASSA